MERVATLVEKLQLQLEQHLPAKQLLLTVQMLHHELTSLARQEPDESPKSDSVAVSMPVEMFIQEPVSEPTAITPVPVIETEKEFQVLQVDEAELEAELEEIKRNAESIHKMSVQSKPPTLFQSMEDELPPTLTQHIPATQKEVHEVIASNTESLNDKLKADNVELSEKLTETPVKDLKKAIGINERYVFINELFRGDEAMYERSIKTINSFTIWPEAEYWVRRELKTKLGWIDSNDTVKKFDALVKRRFS